MQGSSKGSGLSNKDQENDQDQTMQGSGKGSGLEMGAFVFFISFVHR